MSTASRNFKNAAYAQLGRIGKALSSPVRLEILDLLSQRAFRVEELAAELALPIANTSHHLQILSRERLVEREREGVHIRYALADPPLLTPMLVALRKVADARLLELENAVRDFMGSCDSGQPIGVAELAACLEQGHCTIIDVRPEAEYRAAHLPGAVSVPYDELQDHLAQIPKEREVVAYCRGPYCVLAAEAVAKLRAAGFDAVLLADGLPGWMAEGNAVEVG